MWSFTCSPGGQPPVWVKAWRSTVTRRSDIFGPQGLVGAARAADRHLGALIRQNPEVRSRGRSQSVCRSSRLQRHRSRSARAAWSTAITVLGIVYGLIGGASGSASKYALPTPGTALPLEGVYLRVNGL